MKDLSKLTNKELMREIQHYSKEFPESFGPQNETIGMYSKHEPLMSEMMSRGYEQFEFPLNYLSMRINRPSNLSQIGDKKTEEESSKEISPIYKYFIEGIDDY